MNKRLIICGPTCSGKNYLRNKFTTRGFKNDISYTTRKPREEEINGVDYHFLSIPEFVNKIENGDFYEWVQYDNMYYGTGQKEWGICDIFIMETDGISKLTKKDRAGSFIIFLNPSRMIRELRMRAERKWTHKKVLERSKIDHKKFYNFKDYDILIIDHEF